MMDTSLYSQRTILREGSLSGTGLHTGASCTVRVSPAPVDGGICFLKNGKPVDWPVRGDGLPSSNGSFRCSTVGKGADEIRTVEHLLAALSGLGITNLKIDVDGPEIPGLDGSALPFVALLKDLGIVDLGAPSAVYRVTHPIFCGEEGKAIAIYPSDRLSVSYTLDYDHAALQNQKVDFVVTPETFETDIAPARTFCTEREAAALKKNGFGLGATYENTLVLSENGPVGNKLRFEDECARHKVLDILGDLSLLGYPVTGHVVAVRSGHSLNRKLVEQIHKQRGVMSTKPREGTVKKQGLDLEEIKKILPHRYPFLLVDRILEVSDDGVVGIKNVTANEPFFQGHFPQKAVMPGVLIVEALAQVGGVHMLGKKENVGKLAFLASINHARFRKTVVPGDQLRLEVKLVKMKSKIGVMSGTAKVGNEEVCNAEIMFAIVE